tara:strand:- start:1130 stop:1879 length:750 start_codon:yes stop_codon:yes gene_type:complete
MDTAFVIGNGESRNIFPIETLKGKGIIYGCNAIYRDMPDLCDHVVAVNPPMFEELKQWHDNEKTNLKIHGPDDISKWNYILDADEPNDPPPEGLKLYRIWRGGDLKKGNLIRTIDFTEAKGSGMSAVLMAAESGIKNVVLVAFDILGARQWMTSLAQSREQNNIYKNTRNYPSRMNMKAYLKYEWLFQLRQIIRKHPDTNFYFFNRKEYINMNHFLKNYFDQPNIKVGIYADLKRWVEGSRNSIQWMRL